MPQSQFKNNHQFELYILQVAALATLALLLATLGGSDMSLQYIFVIYVGMHQSNYGLSSGRNWEQHSVCGDDPSIQQCSHAAVYTLLHNFTFTLLSTVTQAFTGTVTMQCTCHIMHDQAYHLVLLLLCMRISKRMRPTDRCKGYNDVDNASCQCTWRI